MLRRLVHTLKEVGVGEYRLESARSPENVRVLTTATNRTPWRSDRLNSAKRCTPVYPDPRRLVAHPWVRVRGGHVTVLPTGAGAERARKNGSKRAWHHTFCACAYDIDRG